MPAGWRFDPDRAGIENVATGPGTADALTDAAKRAADQVKALAPGRGSFFDYAAGVGYEPAKDGPDGYEAAVKVESPGWHLPEYGTRNYPARAPLRRGVRQAGLDFREGQ